MGADAKTFTLVPRRGRGLITAYSALNMGDLQDSFQVFQNCYIRDMAWQGRFGDNVYSTTGFNGELRNIHTFNAITATDGTITSHKMIHVGGNIVDEVNSLIATTTAPHEVFFKTVKNRVYFNGSNNAPRIWGPSGGAGNILTTWGINGPVGSLAYLSYTTSVPNNGVVVGICHVNNASATVTYVSGGTDFTAGVGGSWVGKTMIINGILQVNGIASVTNNTTLVLNTVVTLASGNYSFSVQYGNRSWSQPPKYAYAYYNPTTGHCSNISPVLTLAESNMQNVNVEVLGIVINATLYSYGYTRIIIFRTLTDGAQLAGLFLTGTAINGTVTGDGFILNQNGGGTAGYIDNDGTDNNWGTLVGPAEGPIANNPPPNMRFAEYFQGRWFGVPEATQWRLIFSGASQEVPLGVPEECFPAVNFRDVVSDDGAITSVKVIGTTLLVGTLRYTYYLAGSGPGDYQLLRLSDRAFGVNQYAIDEHPGDSGTNSASAIYVSRDRRLWRQLEGGRLEDIGGPIQDKLDGVFGGALAAFLSRKPFLVKVFRIQKLWMLGVGILQNQNNGFNKYDFFFYDFDQGMWYDWGYALTTNPGATQCSSISYTSFRSQTGDSAVYLGISMVAGGSQYASLFENNGFMPTCTITTQAMDMGDRTMQKTSETIWMWVNVNAGSLVPYPGWAVSARYEENGPYVPLMQVTTVGSPRFAGQTGLAFVPQTPTSYHAQELQITIPINGKLFRVDGKVMLDSYAPGV